MTRSRTGCITCRSRKLKCDEVKPECGQCKKASRECRPSDGVVFRHQQNASMNGAGEVQTRGGNGRLGAFYAYRNTFDENNVWVEVPKNVTFLNITDPYNMDATPEPEYRTPTPLIVPQLEERQEENLYRLPYDQAPGLEALSAAAINDYQYLRPVSMHPQTPQDTGASPHSSNNLNFILNPTERPQATPPIDPALSSPATVSTRRESITVTEHEVAFLLRHFSEMCGQWMDLFDLGGYFAHHVPVQAMTNPLLRYAACAYAAKQLGRVRGRKATIGGIVDQPADMEVFPNPEKVDWLYLGAKYYDRAISLLMVELANPHSNNEVPATPSFVEDAFSPQGSTNSPHSSVTETRGNKRRRVSRQTNTNNVDETLAAAAILCVYEFLDMASGAWSRHLSGTKSLFDLADKQGMIAVRSPSSPGTFSQRVPPSRGRRATFWCFARQDCLAALINESQTRLNTEDFRLWKAAGLQLDEQGFVLPSNVEESPDGQPTMREDMISNALIWLMSKIINFIAVGDSVDNVYPQDPTSEAAVYGINQMTLLERWRELEKELDIWHQGLPDTFRACARLPPVTNGSVSPDSPRSMFSEIWYSIPMCGSTMQSYHMARTILLINKPHESSARQSTLTTRLNSYRAIEMEVRHHSHEVIGIALGRPEASVRIHQVQPLFVAGQCLTDRRERRVILDLLKGVEADLGWATDYRVKQLQKEWDWAPET